MGYDLHTHSTYSDGALRPRELIRKAIESGLQGIALTDHDTVSGLDEASEEAEKHRFTFIPGIELTTDYGDVEVHLLGYKLDYKNEALRRKLKAVLESRAERARLMVSRLNKAGIPLLWENVKAETNSDFIGRGHIYRALKTLGVTSAYGRDAFNYFLGKTGIAYVPHREIGTFEALDLILKTDGVPVLAHPGRMADEGLIRKLVDHGLQGIEVYYPTHTPQLIQRYLQLAEDYQLIVTGGSDYHGAFGDTNLGDGQVSSVCDWYKPKISTKKL